MSDPSGAPNPFRAAAADLHDGKFTYWFAEYWLLLSPEPVPHRRGTLGYAQVEDLSEFARHFLDNHVD